MKTSKENFICIEENKPFYNDPRAKWIYENLYSQYKDFVVEIINDKIIIHGDIMVPGEYQSIPIKIDEIYGNVIIDNFSRGSKGQLESLKNFPTIIHGNFDCRNNPNLVSLKDGPIEVYGNFICAGCGLTSLEHMPKIIKGNFYVFCNNIKDLSPVLESKIQNTINAKFNPCEYTKLYKDLVLKNKMLIL